MSDNQAETALPMVDGRCGCFRCEARTKDIYRMIGRCYNCKTEPILILYRVGDPAALAGCPVCGNSDSVHAFRLATADEIPAASSEATA